MEVKKLYLGHFGKFHNREIELAPGINILYGANEAGKSTVHSFVRAMFFGIEKKRGRESKEDLYARYQPWEMPGAYQGSMQIEKGGRLLQVTRSFLAKNQSCSVADLSTGRELTDRELENNALFQHFNELVYRNTISIEQLKAGTDREFAKELQNFIANLSMAKSSEVDVSNALLLLKNKKRELERVDFAIAAKEQEELVLALQEKVKRYDDLSLELEELLEKRRGREQEEEQRKKGLSGKSQGSVAGLVEKAKNFHILEDGIRMDAEALGQMEARMRALEDGTESASMEEDIRRLNRLQEEQKEFQRRMDRERDKEEAFFERKAGKNRLVCGLIAALGLICTVGMAIASMLFGVSLGVLLMLAGGISYLVLAAGLEKKRQVLQKKEEGRLAKELEIGSRKKEILVRNYVMDMEALRKKYSERIGEEAELRHLKERRQERIAQQRSKRIQRDKLMQELRDFAGQLGIEEFGREEMKQEDIKELAAAMERANRQEELDAAEYHAWREEIVKQEERIRYEMDMLAGAAAKREEVLKTWNECLQNLEDSQKEVEAIELAMTAIRELAVEIHNSFGENLNRSISEKVKEITGGKYQKVAIDEQMSVKVLSQNGYLPLERLSAGTNCQIYLAVRLAMAEAFFPEETMPLLLDDAFALYDDERLEAALGYLAERKNQVLLLTCHTREEELLRKMGIGYHKVVI